MKDLGSLSALRSRRVSLWGFKGLSVNKINIQVLVYKATKRQGNESWSLTNFKHLALKFLKLLKYLYPILPEGRLRHSYSVGTRQIFWLMKRLLLIPVLLLALIAFGQNGYEIKVTLKPFKSGYLYLGHYSGKQYPIVDSAKVNDKSEAVFKGPKKLGRPRTQCAECQELRRKQNQHLKCIHKDGKK